jgi:hypothetical protein
LALVSGFRWLAAKNHEKQTQCNQPPGRLSTASRRRRQQQWQEDDMLNGTLERPRERRGFWRAIIALIDHRDNKHNREYLLRRDEQRDRALADHFERLPDNVVEYVNEETDGNRKIWFRKAQAFGVPDIPRVIIVQSSELITEVVQDDASSAGELRS